MLWKSIWGGNFSTYKIIKHIGVVKLKGLLPGAGYIEFE